MYINDEVFGELYYDFGWNGQKVVNFQGEEVTIRLIVEGEEEQSFDQEQYRAYEHFQHQWESIQQELIQSILNYYQERRDELGYTKEVNESYPDIQTGEQLLEQITLCGVCVANKEIVETYDMGLLLDCTWDEENGLGVRMLEGMIIEVGYQDIVM